MEIGKVQTLEVARIKDFGAYLTDIGEIEGGESVLLPKKQLPENIQTGDRIEVFIYRDSSDRLIATNRPVKVQVGELARLKVNDVGNIGAFLDIGLERDVLLPYKEMKGRLAKGDEVLAALYLDRTKRLAATMRIYPYLSPASVYKKDDEVEASVYDIKDIGVFAAVDDKYYGLIPKNEAFGRFEIGDRIRARVIRVRDDGKLDLSPRQKAYIQIEADAGLILKEMERKGGSLEFTDRSEPELIKRSLGLSKNAFKRAVGHLLKLERIEMKEDRIILK